jgi:aryl-alcohol dehydrogenase-like predicted oxidoreductase
MIQRAFGKTELSVSALGFGAGHIGSPEMSEDQAGWLLNQALDLGITLFDTAKGYGLSEARIGRHLSWRRQEIIISSKGGYGVNGVADWTADCIRIGIDQALERLQTDYIDIFHLHSCPLETLQNSDVILALLKAKAQGKIRVAAYSGDNQALLWAVQSGQFGSIECSLNICDQAALKTIVPMAQAQGLGIIAKRPIANAPWRYSNRPVGQYALTYWDRLQTMQLNPDRLSWDEYALRFTAFANGISSAIVGTSQLENLKRNANIMTQGALPSELNSSIQTAFAKHGTAWQAET